jgi:hypothetical protein
MAECTLKQRLRSPDTEIFKAAAIWNRLSVEISLFSALRMILKTALDISTAAWSQIGIYYIVGTGPSRDMMEETALD